jgi:hypothetical protein
MICTQRTGFHARNFFRFISIVTVFCSPSVTLCSSSSQTSVFSIHSELSAYHLAKHDMFRRVMALCGSLQSVTVQLPCSLVMIYCLFECLLVD